MACPRSPCLLCTRSRREERGLAGQWARDLIEPAEHSAPMQGVVAEMQRSILHDFRACTVVCWAVGPRARLSALPNGASMWHARDGCMCWRGAGGMPSCCASAHAAAVWVCAARAMLSKPLKDEAFRPHPAPLRRSDRLRAGPTIYICAFTSVPSRW